MISRKNDILLILFNLRNRNKYVKKYFKLIKKFEEESLLFDILIINEKGNNLSLIDPKKYNLLKYNSKNKIYGMNDIFKEIYNKKNILKKYKFCCFVEDDNFIFPKSLEKSKKFLKDNNNYIACSGDSFLFSKIKNKYSYLNKYNAPNTISQKSLEDRYKYYNGALCYYSLFKVKYFLLILEKINKISDDNLSEVLFNYFAVKIGNLKKLNNIYLARKYPRPPIYNIPKKINWVKNKTLMIDLNIVIDNILKNNKNLVLEESIFKYLGNRFYLQKNTNFIKNLYLKLNEKYFYQINRHQINDFINHLNKL